VARRRYSDETRAAALAALQANGGNVARTAAQIGVGEDALRTWARGLRHPEARQMSVVKTEPLAEAFERLARLMLAVATEGADQLDAKDAMIAAGIATDKVIALRGGGAPTAAELVIRLYGPGLVRPVDPAPEVLADECRDLSQGG
jgi:transposase-like protein